MTLPPLWAMTGLGALLAGSLAGWTVRDWKADSDEAEAKEQAFTQYQALTNELAGASLRYEYLAQDLRAAERTDRETIRETFREITVPAECTAPAGIVSVLNTATDRANTATSGQSISQVPDAAPPPG